MQRSSTALVTAITFLAFSFPNSGLAESLDGVVLFQNVRVFDGKSNALSSPANVLVRGNKIEKITTEDVPTEQNADTTIIDGALQGEAGTAKVAYCSETAHQRGRRFGTRHQSRVAEIVCH